MDSFDDIWKNRFNDSKEQIGDWNTPDDEVWEGIATHISQQRKRRKMFFFWIFSGLLAGLGLLFLLGYFTYFKQPERNISSIDNQLPDTTVNTKIENNKATFSVPRSTHSTAQDQNGRIEMIIDNDNNNTIGQNEYVDQLERNAKGSSDIPEMETPDTEMIRQGSLVEPLPKEAKAATQSNLSSIAPEKVQNDLVSLPTLTFQADNQQVYKDLLVFTPLEASFEPAGKKIFRIAFNVGGVYMRHRISDSYTSDLSAFDFNYSNNFGWQANLELLFAVNKRLDVYGGFQYEQIKTTSGHNSPLAYSPSAESGGQTINDYNLNLATPYGPTETSFIFFRSQDVGSDDVDLVVDFSSQHQLRNISAPVGAVFYPIGKGNRLLPTLRVGFGVNYLSGISSKIETIDTHHDAIQYEPEQSTFYGNPEFEQWHFDYRLGIGIGYQINESTQLQLNYNWNRGINPIFQQNDYQTKIDRHQFSTGVTYKF